jgi:hypothetical protein
VSEYRDDAAATRERARVLEEELAERERELLRQKSEIEQQKSALSAAERELQTLKAAQPRALVADATGERTCASCGKKNAEHYKFCLGCGADLAAIAVSPAPLGTG